MYNRFNFFKYTFAIFTKTSNPENFSKPHYVSKHGSSYFFTSDGVYRYSNHWGRVGNCRWRLEGIDFKQQTAFWGYCNWSDFYKNNDTELIFFIEEISDNKFTYNHQKNAASNKVVLRSASDTAKILKKINEIQESDSWAKHLNYSNYNALKQHFVNELINTNKSFVKIKQEYLLLNNRELF